MGLTKKRIGDLVRVVVGKTLMERSIDRVLVPLMRDVAEELPAGARVLDVGASSAPYRSLFSRHRFETVDVRHDVGADYVGDIHALGTLVPSETYDAVICTEVLEHTERPGEVLNQIRSVLKPGGKLLATTPFIVTYHPDPRDYWRMTPESWSMLLSDWSAFKVIPHGNQLLAVWYLAGVGWGMPLRMLDPLVDWLCKSVVSKRVFLGFAVAATK